MPEHDFEQLRLVAPLSTQELIANSGVAAQDGGFFLGQRIGLVQDRARDLRLAEVVQQRASDDVLLVVLGETQTGGELGGKPGDQEAVLIDDVVILPDDFQPLPDAAIAYRRHDR